MPGSGQRRHEGGRCERRAAPLGAALAVSALLHALLLLLPVGGPARAPEGGRSAPQAAWPAALRLREISSPAAPVSLAPARPAGAPDAPAIDVPSAPGPAPRQEAEQPGATDRDAPRASRFAPAAAAAAAGDADAEVRSRIADQLRPYNDSLADAAETARRGVDWTVKDGSGRRWGVEPGRVHLGIVALSPCRVLLDPISCQFRMVEATRQEQRDLAQRHRELQQQASRVQADEVVKERLRGMRERADARRDSMRAVH